MGVNILKKSGKIITKAMEQVSSCMSPVIPGLIAGGLIKLLILLLKLFGILTDGSTTFQILSAISNAPFYFLPVLAAYSSAIHFGVEPVHAIIAVSSLILPDFISLMQGSASVKFAGIPVYKTNYAYTVLPVILMVYVMSVITKYLKRIISKKAADLLLPFISILVTAILGILLIGPSMAFVSRYLYSFITYLQKHYPVFAWILFDATAPLQVITGMHWVFVTVAISRLGEYGLDNGFMVGYFLLAMSLSAITLAVRIKTKDKNLQKSALGMFITIFFTGTSEPALYGICIPYRKAMLFCILSGAAAGLYHGIVGIHCYAYSFPTIFTSLIFQSSTEPGNFLKALIAGAISFGVGFIGILLTFHDEK